MLKKKAQHKVLTAGQSPELLGLGAAGWTAEVCARSLHAHCQALNYHVAAKAASNHNPVPLAFISALIIPKEGDVNIK